MYFVVFNYNFYKNMSNNQLYIIGNGFDIFHEIQSRYSDFEIYVKHNDKQLYDVLDEYFNSEDLWSEFEEALAHIDIDRIIETAKEREKQQIIDAYLQGDEDSHYLNNRDRMGEGYYNETFKSE